MTRYDRKKASKVVKEIIFIVTEGKITEPDYFNRIKQLIKNKKGLSINKKLTNTNKNKHKSAPNKLIQQVKNIRQNEKNLPLENYQYYIVCDKDDWTENQFKKLKTWVADKNNKNYYVMTNPCFEYWLLLHADEEKNISDLKGKKDNIKKRLEKLGILDKQNSKKLHKDFTFYEDNINKAIKRSKFRCNAEYKNERSENTLLDKFATSSVHCLLEEIFR
mgnify:CR=1 FL=1